MFSRMPVVARDTWWCLFLPGLSHILTILNCSLVVVKIGSQCLGSRVFIPSTATAPQTSFSDQTTSRVWHAVPGPQAVRLQHCRLCCLKVAGTARVLGCEQLTKPTWYHHFPALTLWFWSFFFFVVNRPVEAQPLSLCLTLGCVSNGQKQRQPSCHFCNFTLFSLWLYR